MNSKRCTLWRKEEVCAKTKFQKWIQGCLEVFSHLLFPWNSHPQLICCFVRSALWSRYAKYPFLRQHDAGWEVLYPRRINGWELVGNDCFYRNFCWLEDDTTRPLPVSQFVGKMTIFTCLLFTPCLLLTSTIRRVYRDSCALQVLSLESRNTNH